MFCGSSLLRQEQGRIASSVSNVHARASLQQFHHHLTVRTYSGQVQCCIIDIVFRVQQSMLVTVKKLDHRINVAVCDRIPERREGLLVRCDGRYIRRRVGELQACEFGDLAAKTDLHLSS